MHDLHRAATNIERRRHDIVDAKPVEPEHGTYDIDDRVDGSNLVKVHLLNRDAVDRGFRLANPVEQVNGSLLSAI